MSDGDRSRSISIQERELTNAETEQLVQALVAAIGDELPRFARFRLDMNLEEAKDRPTTAINLVDSAVMKGKLSELVEQAFATNPITRS